MVRSDNDNYVIQHASLHAFIGNKFCEQKYLDYN